MPKNLNYHTPSSLLRPPSSLPPLFIRADSTAQIGTGHIMRCIALGQAWQDQGGKVVFISHCESEKLRERIINEGFELIPVDHPHPHPSDLEKTLAVINNVIHSPVSLLPPPSPVWLVLDGYHFTPDYHKAIRNAGIRLLVIDDMNHLPYYHADIILNQNIHATELKYNCDPDTKLLLGTKYVLLRREFLKYKDFKREIPEKARKILVTMGGADPGNVTLKVIQVLILLNDPDLEVNIVIGPSNPHIGSIRKELSLSPFPFHILHGTDDMPSLMAWADLAISGAGSTVWELAFMRVPSILYKLAINQEQIADSLVNKNFAILASTFNHNDMNYMIQEIISGKNSQVERKKMSQLNHKIVDGLGISRIIKKVKIE